MTGEATHTQPASQLAPSVESITQLVHGFYGDVRRDPLLGPVFEKALHGQWDAHLQRLVDFWSTVALGTRSFKGDVFGKHMALEGVTPAHFAAWVGLWQQHTSRAKSMAGTVPTPAAAKGPSRADDWHLARQQGPRPPRIICSCCPA